MGAYDFAPRTTAPVRPPTRRPDDVTVFALAVIVSHTHRESKSLSVRKAFQRCDRYRVWYNVRADSVFRSEPVRRTLLIIIDRTTCNIIIIVFGADDYTLLLLLVRFVCEKLSTTATERFFFFYITFYVRKVYDDDAHVSPSTRKVEPR